jgi:hypothetical protein
LEPFRVKLHHQGKLYVRSDSALFLEATPAQKIDNHIVKALGEIRGVHEGFSRNDFADEVQLRVTKDLGPGHEVRDRVEELLDAFMSRDDST